MFSTAVLLLTTAAFLSLAASALAWLEVDRRRMRRLVSTAVRHPQAVEQAWVSPPDAEGLRRLFVKTAGQAHARTVALDFDVDEAVRRFSLAGIHVGFERAHAGA
ncbi:MAG: hypothetical protein ACTHL8_16120 [Burkholderiaceae bacterium]